MQLHCWELKFYFLRLLFPRNCFTTHKQKPRAEREGSPRGGSGGGVRGAAREPGSEGRRCQAGSRVLPRDATTQTAPGVRAVPGDHVPRTAGGGGGCDRREPSGARSARPLRPPGVPGRPSLRKSREPPPRQGSPRGVTAPFLWLPAQHRFKLPFFIDSAIEDTNTPARREQ